MKNDDIPWDMLCGKCKHTREAHVWRQQPQVWIMDGKCTQCYGDELLAPLIKSKSCNTFVFDNLNYIVAIRKQK